MPKFIKVALITAILVAAFIAGVVGLAMGWVVWRQHAFATRQDTRDLKEQVGKMAETYLKDRPRAALIIGVRQGDADWVGGFGHTKVGFGPPPDGDSVFEIGSITKVFTGIALARLVNDGVVTLEDPMAKHLPTKDRLQQDGREGITLQHLATHTSGLPRLAGNFWAVVTNQQNPYVSYSGDQLFEDVVSVKVQRPAGAGYEYSNYAVALLGNLLANAAGETYESLLDRTILQPLKMTSTALTTKPAMSERLVKGFTPNGAAQPNWDFAGFAPAGGLRSTANDLLAFIRFCLEPDESDLGKAVALATQVHSQGMSTEVGLGWHRRVTVEKLDLWWHNGGTGGYTSFLGIDREHQTGVIVIANYGDVMAGKYDVDKIGMNILQLAAGVSLE